MKYCSKNYFFLLLSTFFSITLCQKQKVDLVIFSYNRPMQLYALLESVERYMIGVGDTIVIYRASNTSYAHAYEKVYKRFPAIIPFAQATSPKNDFKLLTQKAVFDSPHEYILFAVDDIIVKDYVNLFECIEVMESEGAYGFYLRLGKNTHFCYPLNRSQGVPHLRTITEDIFAWKFMCSTGDWRYPQSVDMSLWRKKDIAQKINDYRYTTPTRLEEALGAHRGAIMRCEGLCYESSKIVNLPLNIVQTIYKNRAMHSYSPGQLLEKFNAGLKIDIMPLYQIKNRSAHMNYDLTFLNHRDDAPYNIGLLLVATSDDIELVRSLIASAEKYFCINHNVTYFVFTDSNAPLPENTVRIYQETLEWPSDMMMQCQLYEQHANLFVDMDFLFVCGVDMLFTDTVGDEVLCDEPNEQSPYLSQDEEKSCIGSFTGGRTGAFLKHAHFIAQNI